MPHRSLRSSRPASCFIGLCVRAHSLTPASCSSHTAPQQVTIATALAGRGTDILLGGNPKGLVQMLLENRLLERLAGPGKPAHPGVAAGSSFWLGGPFGIKRRMATLLPHCRTNGGLPVDVASGNTPNQNACRSAAGNPRNQCPCLPPHTSRCTGAGDLADFDRRLPLSNLSVAFTDLDEFDQLPLEQLPSAAADPSSVSPSLPAELPLEVCSAYCELRAALAALLPEPAGVGRPQNGAAQDAQLPWRRYGAGYSKRAAQYATDWLSQQLEAAEVQRAHLRWALAWAHGLPANGPWSVIRSLSAWCSFLQRMQSSLATCMRYTTRMAHRGVSAAGRPWLAGAMGQLGPSSQPHD